MTTNSVRRKLLRAAVIAIVGLLAVLGLKTAFAIRSFFAMEENMRARKSALIALRRYVLAKKTWPSDWRQLSPFLPNQVDPEWVQQHVLLDFELNLTADVESHDILKAVRTNGRSLPESWHEEDAEALITAIGGDIGRNDEEGVFVP